jgi:NhaA family Na+:H+ antiporter
LAIIVIAVFFTESIQWGYLGAALVTVALFGWHVRSRRPRWWVLVPLFAIAWVWMHASGVHATVAGVLMGFTVPARFVFGERESRTHHYDRAVRPWSQGLALPVFAFFSAGVSLVDAGGLGQIVSQAVFPAITLGLVAGKLVGVLGTTAVLTRLTPMRLAQGIGVRDLLPVALLSGIGFTVALLVAELSFGYGSEYTDASKAAILTGSLVAALLGAVMLRWDARRARTTDMNRDGVEDQVTEFIGDERNDAR